MAVGANAPVAVLFFVAVKAEQTIAQVALCAGANDYAGTTFCNRLIHFR
jgi:hypothetical protein